MKLLCLFLIIGTASPLLATLRLQELNRISLTGKISDKLLALGHGELLLPIVSSLLVREDSILLGSDERRRIAGRLAIDSNYETTMTRPAGTVTDQVSHPSRLNSRLISKTSYAIYERAGILYLLVVNVANDYLSAPNIMDNLLIDFDYAVTTTRDLDEFIKKRALQRRGVYLAVAEIKDDRLNIHHVGAKIGEQFWSSVYPLVISNGKIKSLTEVASFSYRPPAGNNFMLMRRKVTGLQQGDSLFLVTGVNDFESSEVMLSAPRALDKHIAENLNKLSYYLGEDRLGLIDHDNLLRIASSGHDWGKNNDTQGLLERLDNVNYTLLYYLHHDPTTQP